MRDLMGNLMKRCKRKVYEAISSRCNRVGLKGALGSNSDDVLKDKRFESQTTTQSSNIVKRAGKEGLIVKQLVKAKPCPIDDHSKFKNIFELNFEDSYEENQSDKSLQCRPSMRHDADYLQLLDIIQNRIDRFKCQVESETEETYSTYVAMWFLKRDFHYAIKVDIGCGRCLHIKMDIQILMDIEEHNITDKLKL